MIERDLIILTRPTAKQILARVAAERGFKVSDLTGPNRARKVAYARFAAIREIRANTKLSTPQIGALFNIDHASVLYALGVLKGRVPSDLRASA